MDGYNKSITNTNCVRETWRYGWGDSYGCGLSWPPKSYTCSFCKREFRSAQALGGHMNVHRRDRARLRGSPPWELQHEPNPNPNPNPNPDLGTTTRQICLPNLNHVPQVHVCDTNFSPLESFPHTTTTTYPLPPFSPSPSFVSNAKPSYYCGATENPKPRKAMKALFGVADVEEMEGKEGHLLRRRDVVRLDMKIGIHDDELDENLDLELRLGYA